MMIIERQTRMKELLAAKGVSSLDTLVQELNVSASTVRRDIESFEQLGLVSRSHGSVVWVGEKQSGVRPYAFVQRMSFQTETKIQIAKAARHLVAPGDTVLIDGGTTTYHFAEQLLGMSIQLVTNSLPIADLFLNDEQVELILAGGLMYPRYGVFLGPMAETMLASIHTKTMFLSVAGVFGNQMYNQNQLLVEVERRMMQQAQHVVLLIDSGKFGQQALVKLGSLDQIDTVVCDQALAAEHQQVIRDSGCELILAGP